MDKETILIFSAHSDDLQLGMGATVAKYADEGKRNVQSRDENSC